ncbi:MAG: hypothetical protein LBQ04_02020 [Endomicrobium sp.]|jgi:TRAP-type C4-dicarboxylate transport system substrate-binding protein|nr:hypothetical protein [Endomicrobium sp.]
MKKIILLNILINIFLISYFNSKVFAKLDETDRKYITNAILTSEQRQSNIRKLKNLVLLTMISQGKIEHHYFPSREGGWFMSISIDKDKDKDSIQPYAFIPKSIIYEDNKAVAGAGGVGNFQEIW